MEILQNGFKQLDLDRRRLDKEWARLSAEKELLDEHLLYGGHSEAAIFFQGVHNPLSLKKRYKDAPVFSLPSPHPVNKESPMAADNIIAIIFLFIVSDNEYGVTIQFDFYENEQFKTKLTTLMASNAVPDIFFTWELSYLQPFVEGGKVADITSPSSSLLPKL